MVSVQLLFARDLQFSLVGVYNQSRMAFEFDTRSSQFFGDETESYSAISPGVLFEKALKNKWSLEFGVLYLTRGFQMKSSVWLNGGPVETQEMNYWKNLHIPIVGRFRPTKSFTGVIGMYYNSVVGKATRETRIPNYPTSKSELEMKNLGLVSSDYGITYGAGVNLHLSSTSDMIIELRMTEGLSNIIDTTQVGEASRATSRDIMLLLGFLI